MLGLLYLVQVTLAVAGESLSQLLALHVFNAGLLLATSLVVIAKIGRSHSG